VTIGTLAAEGHDGERGAETVPTFITIGYGDQDGYERTDAVVREEAHAHDAEQVEAGVRMGMAGTPVQVRNHDAAGTTTTPGPFMRSELPVAGFALIEAADLDEAIAIASRAPCAVAQGVVEVWPIDG
jgi:hypothetical protein